MMGGIDSELTNRYMRNRDNPAALAARQKQTGDILDLIVLQKLKSDKEAAMRDMQMAANPNPTTIKEQREGEVRDLTQREVAAQMGMAMPARPPGPPGMPPQGGPRPPQRMMPPGGIGAAPRGPMVGQPPRRPAPAGPRPMPPGGISQAPSPAMRFKEGGIVPGYQTGGVLMGAGSGMFEEEPERDMSSMWNRFKSYFTPDTNPDGTSTPKPFIVDAIGRGIESVEDTIDSVTSGGIADMASSAMDSVGEGVEAVLDMVPSSANPGDPLLPGVGRKILEAIGYYDEDKTPAAAEDAEKAVEEPVTPEEKAVEPAKPKSYVNDDWIDTLSEFAKGFVSTNNRNLGAQMMGGISSLDDAKAARAAQALANFEAETVRLDKDRTFDLDKKRELSDVVGKRAAFVEALKASPEFMSAVEELDDPTPEDIQRLVDLMLRGNKDYQTLGMIERDLMRDLYARNSTLEDAGPAE